MKELSELIAVTLLWSLPRISRSSHSTDRSFIEPRLCCTPSVRGLMGEEFGVSLCSDLCSVRSSVRVCICICTCIPWSVFGCVGPVVPISPATFLPHLIFPLALRPRSAALVPLPLSCCPRSASLVSVGLLSSSLLPPSFCPRSHVSSGVPPCVKTLAHVLTLLTKPTVLM